MRNPLRNRVGISRVALLRYHRSPAWGNVSPPLKAASRPFTSTRPPRAGLSCARRHCGQGPRKFLSRGPRSSCAFRMVGKARSERLDGFGVAGRRLMIFGASSSDATSASTCKCLTRASSVRGPSEIGSYLRLCAEWPVKCGCSLNACGKKRIELSVFRSSF
jgi:hypothetical protein